MIRVEFTFYNYRFGLLKKIGDRWELVSSVKVIAGPSGNRCTIFYNYHTYRKYIGYLHRKYEHVWLG